MQREYRHLFPPLQALIITQTNHPPGDFFFVKSDKSSDFCGVWRLESTNHSAVRPTRSSQSREETHPSASRLQMNRACAWPPPFPPWRSSPPWTFVLTSRRVVITTSGAFKSLWSEQDGDLTFLHKIQLFSTTLHL